MTYTDYRNTVERKCAYYGMAHCPLQIGQIRTLFKLGISVDTAYSIACDLHSGADFGNSMVAHAAAEDFTSSPMRG